MGIFRRAAAVAIVLTVSACQGGGDTELSDLETRSQQEQIAAMSAMSGVACLAPALDALLDSQQNLSDILASGVEGADPQALWDEASPRLLEGLASFVTALQHALLRTQANEGACAPGAEVVSERAFIAGNPFAGTELASYGAALDELATMVVTSRASEEPADLPSQALTITTLLAQLTQAGADLLLATNLNLGVAGLLSLAGLVTTDLYPLLGSLAAMDPTGVAESLTNLLTGLLGAFQPG